MKIKIVTGYEGYCVYKDILIENLLEYCSKHNYQLFYKFQDWEHTNRYPYWRKLELIRNNLFDCDYLLWIDADCMFIDMNRKLESIIDDNDFFITKEDVVQAGCFLIKNTTQVSDFLKYWWDKGEINKYWKDYTDENGIYNAPNNDNTILTNILDNSEESIRFKYLTNMEFVTKHVHFYNNQNCFIVHTVGSLEEEKFSFMSDFKNKIKR
jgi:hypothetical protein